MNARANDDTTNDHGRRNAESWAQTIAQYARMLDADAWDRLDELKDERQDLLDALADEDSDKKAAADAITEWDADNGEEFMALQADAAAMEGCNDADDVRERVQESALSVEVRSGWSTDPADLKPEEFRILLTTGGPALQIMGELDDHGEPRRAWLECQDWGTPWTEYHGDACSMDDVLAFARCFSFGEG